MPSRRVLFWIAFLLAGGLFAAWTGAFAPAPLSPAAGAALLVPAPSDPNAPKFRVLFIGNSLTYAEGLPAMIQGLARTAGVDLTYEQHTPGGSRLVDHAHNREALAQLARGGWDAVVLQEQSQWPALPDERVRSEIEPSVVALAGRARAASPSARLFLYETPAHRDGDARLGAESATYGGMQARIDRTYGRLAALVNGTLVPAGEAWALARSEHPEIELYADAVHPGRAGAYLIACVFQAVLLGRSPVGSAFTAGLAPAVAATLQAIAWSAAAPAEARTP